MTPGRDRQHAHYHEDLSATEIETDNYDSSAFQDVAIGEKKMMNDSKGADKAEILADGKIVLKDEMEANGREPTAEEDSTLRRVADHIPMSAWLVVAVEFCERFTYYGLSGPFQNYIQYPYTSVRGAAHPGAIGGGQTEATALNYFFQFFCYCTPIFGAIIADQFLGKYKAILVFCIVYMLGVLILVCTSIPTAINAGAALPGLIVAMIIIGFGTGGIKSNVSPLVAEQYQGTKPTIRLERISIRS